MVLSTYSKDRLGQLLDCIKSLEMQTLPPKEIILVLDPDQDLVDFYKSKLHDCVKIVISGGFGLSKARNAGVTKAEGEIIAFIDDDAVAENDWLEKLLKNYEDSSVVSVGGLIKPQWEEKRPVWFPEELDWIVGCSYRGLPEIKTCVRNAIGCNMSFRKTIFDDVGYFRTDIGRFGNILLGSEEPELSTRILAKFPDSKIVYDPEAVVFHKIPKSRKSICYLWRRSYYEGLSKALLVSSKVASNKALSTEEKYLKYQLRYSIPSRLRKFYSFRILSQLIVLFISFFAVFLGFSVGKILKF